MVLKGDCVEDGGWENRCSLFRVKLYGVRLPKPLLWRSLTDSVRVFTPRYWRRTLGMQVRYARHGDYRFCYSFRGRPGHNPSILMLHGFSAHKDMWLSMVKVRR